MAHVWSFEALPERVESSSGMGALAERVASGLAGLRAQLAARALDEAFLLGDPALHPRTRAAFMKTAVPVSTQRLAEQWKRIRDQG